MLVHQKMVVWKYGKEQVSENIFARRSVRSYADKKISEETIKDLLKVGTYAPNGANAQGLRFVVLENKEKIDHYSGVAKELFLLGVKKNQPKDFPPSESMEGLLRMLSNPEFHLFYHAPTVVFIFVHPSAMTPVEDASLAVENMFLYARSLGIGSCWIGFANSLMHSQEFLKECKVPSDHKLVTQLIFGYPKGDFGKGKRNEPEIISWIR
jgi:nitroreductase